MNLYPIPITVTGVPNCLQWVQPIAILTNLTKSMYAFKRQSHES